MTGRRIDPRPPIDIGVSHVPVLYAFTQIDQPTALCLLPDDAQGARLATEHLLRAGRRHFAHVTGPHDFEAVGFGRARCVPWLADHGATVIGASRSSRGHGTRAAAYEAA